MAEEPETVEDLLGPGGRTTPPPSSDPTREFAYRRGLQPGETLGRYEIIRLLGEGGMGAVYLARDPALAREVALKVVGSDRMTPDRLARFEREAQAAAGLSHPGIVAIHDVVISGPTPFFVMDAVEGRTLEEHRARASRDELLELLEQVARAIHVAHTKGVLHRDLKPGNVMVGSDGRATVMDFGLAGLIEPPAASRLTEEGESFGTPHYMAPEQIQGELERIGPHSDVFALGVMLYLCLTGELPFVGKNVYVVATKILGEEPVPPARLVSDIPAQLEAICLECLAKDPAQRYASALDLADALRDFREGAPTTPRSIPASVLVVLGLVLIGGGVALGSFLSDGSDPDPGAKHEREADAPTKTSTPAAKTAGKTEPPAKTAGKTEPPAKTAGKTEPPAKTAEKTDPPTRTPAKTDAIKTTDEPPPLQPKQTIALGLRLRVVAILPDGARVLLGHSEPGERLEVPPCRVWFVEPLGPNPDLAALAQEVKRSSIPGVRLTRVDLTNKQLVPFEGLPSLSWLELVRCRWDVGDSLIRMPALRSLAFSLDIPADFAWDRLVAVGALRSLRVFRSMEFHERSLSHLARVPLRSLDLSGCRVTDAGLAHIGKIRSLVSLRLKTRNQTVKRITAQGLAHLRALRHLTELDISGTAMLSEAALAHLGQLTGLTTLRLAWCKGISGKKELTFLKALGAIQTLDLSGTKPSPTAVAGLDHLRNLRRLELGGLPRTNGLPQLALADLRWLRHLGLTRSNVNDAALEPLASMTRLTSVDLSSCRSITDGGLQHLGPLFALDTLDLRSTRIKGPGLKHLTTSVTHLDLSDCYDLDLRSLSTLTSLRSLAVGSKKRSADDLVHLQPLNKLTRLDLSGSYRLTGDLAALGRLPQLRELDLSRCAIADADLEHLSRAPALESLTLERCRRVGDAGLGYIARIQTLRTLDLRNCRVTDEGLRVLTALPRLQRLSLSRGGKVTLDAVRALRAKLPGCQILFE